jgi:molybdopterin-guanine dinucleotide biosynthesis protein MobB
LVEQCGAGPDPPRISTDDPEAQATVAFCGWSGSGKTTLLESLVSRLTRRGLAVAVVKHDAHGVALDTPGKDSDRLFRAGATVTLRGPEETAVRARPSESTGLARVVRGLLRHHDAVLVEGHKGTPLPKVWLGSADGRPMPPAVEHVVEVLAWGDARCERAEEIVLARLEAAVARRPVVGGVLVGGASRRMGRPKQLLEVAGRPMVEGVASALHPHVDELVLLGDGPVTTSIAGARRLPDAPGIRGPLAGILAAMRWAPHATWVFTSCDLPRVNAAAIRWLLEQRRPGRWAVLPRLEGGVEPLLAVYEPQAAELLEDLAARGQSAPRCLAECARVSTPTPPDHLAGCWFNANTPADLASLAAG